MGEFQTREKGNGIYWKEIIGLYRASKTVRNLLKKISFSQLSEVTGFSKNYICGVKEFSIKPSKQFLSKLKEVENGNKRRKRKNRLDYKRGCMGQCNP